MTQVSHLDAVQGAGEERPQMYFNTSRTHCSQATPQCAKSLSGVTSSAGQQAKAVRGLRR